MVNKELNQRTRSTPDHMPRIAGQAHWLRALKHRLEGPMEVSPLDYIVIYSFQSWYILVLHTVCKVKICSKNSVLVLLWLNFNHMLILNR